MTSYKKYKRILPSIVLVLVLLFSTFFSYGELYTAYAAESDPSLTDWKITGKGLGGEYELKIENTDEGYILPIPDDLIGNRNSKLTIAAPEGYVGGFSITYDSFTIDQYAGVEKTVSSENGGSIELADYFFQFNQQKKYIYTKQLKIKAGNDEYTVQLKPYCGLYSLTFGRPMKQRSDTEWYATAVKGSQLTISAQGYCNATVKINGEPNSVNYTAEDGIQTFNIEVSYEGEDAQIDPKTYTLKLETIENDYKPVITSHKNNSTIQCTQYDDYAIEIKADNTNENTTYKWEHKNSIKGDFITLEESSPIYKPDTTKPVKNTIANQYKVTVTNEIDGIKYTASVTLKLQITALEVPTPEIVQQPVSAEYTAGQQASALTVSVNGVPGGKKTYQWYSNSENNNTGGTAIEGATKASFIPPANTAGTTYYYCTIYETEQGITCKEPAVSECAEITVNPLNLGMEGNGTEDDPYQIKFVENLKNISDYVDEGFTFSNTFFQFKDDITLPADWDPIGSTKDGSDRSCGPNDSKYGTNLLPFSGILDGKDGDTIHTVTVAENGKPLLDYVREATVRNLNIYGKRINGAGLVDHYAIDYGDDGSYNTGVPETIVIDNVTLKSGSSTKKAGLISGQGSGSNTITIQNCTVESGVTVGYDKDEWQIGSFADTFNGMMINCSSAADVYGRESVGGLIGRKGQSMGVCAVINSSFTGSVVASGDKAGGIVGSGYGAESAPNTPVVSVQNCYVSGKISGNNWVGGILGAEPVCENCWANGSGSVSNNCFYGTVEAKGDACGAIIGFLRSYDKYQGVENNYFVDECGAEKAIGKIQEIIYVSHPKYGAEYGIEEGSFDENSGGIAVSEEGLKDNSTIAALNSGAGSLKNWTKNENGYPVLSEEPVAYQISISGSYKTDYFVGGTFSSAGMKVMAKLSDGSTKEVPLNEVEFTGFDSSVRGIVNVTVKYGVAETTYEVRILEEQPRNIAVSFVLYGDKNHDSDKDGERHTLAANNLTVWVPEKSYTVNTNSTVWDLLKLVERENSNIMFSNPSGNYVDYITYNGTTLGEFTNGKNSGWMYTLNGTHPLLGVSEQFLNNGDRIVWHYTDDYTKEEGSDKWDIPGQEPVTEVTTSGSSGSATTTAPTEVTVSGTTVTASVKKENVEAVLKQAKENKSTEIVLNVAASDTKGAETVKVQLDTATVKSIVADTSASITVKTENGQVSLDREALTTIASEAKGTTITLEVVKVDKPTETQQKAAGTNGQVLQLTIKSGDKIISYFNKGKATVTVEIPSKLKDKKVAAIHIAEDGKIEQMSGKTVKIDGKDYYTFGTPHFSAFALVDADELGLEVNDEEANIEKIKELVSDMSLKASSSKTSKKNIKVTLTVDKSTAAAIKEIKDMGYTVKYKYYRSTKKASKYQAKVTKTTRSFTNTAGKKETKYYYKARIQVYDKDGNLVAQTALKQCKYAARTWTK